MFASLCASPGSPEPLLLPRTFETVPKSSASQSKSQGRLTRKDLRLHKLVFEEDVLPDGTEVAYYSRGQKLLVGYKKGFGIVCSCCNNEVSPSQFEAHAGLASRRKPYLHIYTSNGVSLHELAISLSKCGKFSTIENDDLCQICKDGGDLVCCDGCPRSFHKECLSLTSIPDDKWYCKFCVTNHQKDMFLERNANAIAAGRVAGVDFMEDINKRCIRIVKTMDADFGGCAFCRGHDFDKSFGPRTVILCDQCEKEFHVGCLRDNNMQDLKELPEGNWFCCKECDTIHSSLQKLVVRGEEKLTDEVIKQKQKQNSMETEESFDIRWRLLCERVDSSDDSSILLSDAVTIFHERFDPIVVDGPGRQGDRDLIPSMVHGRNIKGQELGGMYCAVLLVNHVVVSAAIFRVFGQELAELPLVATRSQFQGQGYFQVLYDRIEQLLGLLGVKTFVLPAAEEAESIWMKKFGFSKMTHDEVLKYRKSYQTMVFQGTSMLQKPIPKSPTIVKSESS
ncbi:Increased DNA methylation 1 [Linum perenne]